MSTTAALQTRTQTCPAWCTAETDGAYGMHLGEVHEVGGLTLCLAQAPGEATPTIGISDDMDQEFCLSRWYAQDLS